MTDIIQKLADLNITVKENEPLKNHTTFKIGGPAKLFVEIDDKQKLIEVLKLIMTYDLRSMTIGGGSNILVSDDGFDGVVIKIKPGELKIDETKVTVDAGYQLSNLINKTLDAELVELEFCAGIPGTIGGGIKGNAGAYGKAMENIIESVDFINDNLEIQTFTNAQCQFAYRNSTFKKHDSWLILSAVLKLKKGNVKESRELIKQRIKHRLDNHPLKFPSAGCAFKNIIYSDDIIEKFKSLGWEILERFKKNKEIPTGWIIENLGLKGKTIGQAQISKKHANYIVNLGGATADDVVQLISYIKQQVRDKVGIQLEEEIQYIGY